MLHERRLKFVYTQVGVMLLIIIAFTAFESLRLDVFYGLSYISFVLLYYLYNMDRLPKKPRKRLHAIILLGGIGFVALLAYRVIPIIW